MEQSVRVPSVTEQRILEGLKNIIDPGRLPGGTGGAVALVVKFCDGQYEGPLAASAIDEYRALCDDVCQLITNDAATEPLRALLKTEDFGRVDDSMIRWLHEAGTACKRATRYSDILAFCPFLEEWEKWSWSYWHSVCEDFSSLIYDCRIICENKMPATSQEPVKTTSTTPDMGAYFSPDLVSRIKNVVEVEKIQGAAEFASLYIAITLSSSGGIIKTGCGYTRFAKHFAPSINSKTFTRMVHVQEDDWFRDTKPDYSGNPSKTTKRIRRYLNALDGGL